MLFGPNGVGKGMRVLVPNLLTISGKSIVVIDPKGQLAAMTAKYRHETLREDVKVIDPFGVLAEVARQRPAEYKYLIDHHLIESDGFNPLAALDPESKTFYDDAAVIAEALIKIQGNDPHWPESAQGLVTALVMWERQQYGSDANLEHVREMLTEADEYDDKGHLVRGLRVTAAHMVAKGGFEIASLAGRFSAENTTDEIESVKSTADTQTRWLLSRPMRADMKKKDGVDFRRLKSGDRAMTVYVILPANFLETHSIWLRQRLEACASSSPLPSSDPIRSAENSEQNKRGGNGTYQENRREKVSSAASHEAGKVRHDEPARPSRDQVRRQEKERSDLCRSSPFRRFFSQRILRVDSDHVRFWSEPVAQTAGKQAGVKINTVFLRDDEYPAQPIQSASGAVFQGMGRGDRDRSIGAGYGNPRRWLALYVAGGFVLVASTRQTAETAIHRALVRALPGVNKRFNAAELDSIHVTSFPGFRIARVTVQARQIQSQASLN